MTNIVQYPVPIPVTNGNYPQFKFAIFGDDLTTVSTAGYLNSSGISAGSPLSNADVVMALYSFNINTSTGTFGIFTVNISASTGQITLTVWANAGDVVLPTTANYLAHFTNSAGQISSVSANVTNAGNISAGLSGTAGSLISFPATANTGSLIFTASANIGNVTTTIRNSSMGQASNISIPDPGAASANFVLNTGPTVMTSGSSITMFKVNATEAATVVNANGVAGKITTSPLVTGPLGSYDITWNNTFITAASIVLITFAGGTNTTDNITIRCVPGPAAGTADLTIYNDNTTTPLNGTVILSYLVM